MTYNHQYIKQYLPYTKFIIILFLFWISLNTGSKYIEIEYLISEVEQNKFNFIRAILPFFIFFYLLVYEYIFKKEYLFNFNYFFKLFFLYGFLQIAGLLYYLQNLHEYYWIVCLFSVLIFYHYVSQDKNNKLINLVFLSNISFVFVLFTIFMSLTIKNNLLTNDLLYYSNVFNLYYKNEMLPRSSGISRYALILFIFFNALYFFKRKKFLFIILNIIFISSIFLLQSRGALLSFLIIFIVINFIYKFDNFKDRLKYIIVFLLFPFLIFAAYPNVKILLIEKFGEKQNISEISQKELDLFNIKIRDNLRENLISKNYSLPPDIFILQKEDKFIDKITSFSNNRINAWNYLLQMFFNNEINENMKKKLSSHNKFSEELIGYELEKFLKKEKKNLFTGHGPQADRHFLYNPQDISADSVVGPFGAHASNAYVYSLICSGLLGFIAFILLNMITFFKTIKILINKKLFIFNNDPYLSSSLLIIIFLQFRALLENSYSVFGVDLLIFVSAYLVIHNNYIKIKN